MDHIITNIVDSFFIPPGLSFSLIVVGMITVLYRYRLGMWIIGMGALTIYLFSTPFVAIKLMQSLSAYPALSSTQITDESVEAIVVLAGGRDSPAPEYGGDTVSDYTLQRIRYGAWLKRRTNLPLLVTGGRLKGETLSEAQLMRDVLQKEFNIEVNWVESQSRTTLENAKYSTRLLSSKGISRVYVVTHAWHMKRAVEAFEYYEMEVVAAPTAFELPDKSFPTLSDFLPNRWGMRYTALALHEAFGRLWYNIRYY